MRLEAALVLALVPIGAAAVALPRLAPTWFETAPTVAMAEAPAVAPPRLSGSVRVPGRADGHFQVTAQVGSRSVPFMVDTGATLVALSWESGRDLGLVAPGDPMTVSISTANGTVKARRITIDRLRIDDIDVTGVDALVLPQGALSTNLLGMSFLSRLSRFGIDKGTLVLEQ